MHASAIINGVTSQLSRVPVSRRRPLAATLLRFAALFAAIGAVAATGGGTSAAPVFAAVALVVAVLLGLIAWGVQRSIRLDEAEARLDAAVQDVLAAHGGHASLCGCGVEHDPSELTVVDAEPDPHVCSHDGTGVACAHECETCVLAALKRP
jgi:hypothetical protein